VSALAEMFGVSTPTALPLKTAFMRWQCRVRQTAMRERNGQPDDAVMPAVTVSGETEPLGHVITVMSKSESYSKTPELMHMVKHTNDPAQRRQKALAFFQEAHYQKPEEFSDTLTATFAPGSEGAARILDAGECVLDFTAYGHGFRLHCRAHRLQPREQLFQATWWHNSLFNPNMNPETIFVGFEPDWSKSEEIR
jgi:hypothetical protein